MEARVVGVLIRHEMREVRRNRWFLAFAAVFTVSVLGLSLMGLSGLGTFGVTGFGRTAASLLHLVMLLVPLMSLVLGALGLAGDREQGTLLTLLAQPVSAGEVFAGKWLAALAALWGVVLSGYAAAGALIVWKAGPAQAGAFAALGGYTLLLAGVCLGLGLLIAAAGPPRTGAAAGAALVVWLVIVFLSDLGMMGTAAALNLPPGPVLWMSLANPVQVFKLGAVDALHGALDILGPAGRYAADLWQDRLGWLMAGLLAGWSAAAAGGAAWLFHRTGAR